MSSLKKQFPYADGWIHAHLTLTKGHNLTPGQLADNMRGTLGCDEIGHVEIRGNKAVVISRSKKPEEQASA